MSTRFETPLADLRTRVALALFFAESGTVDGAHHKQWVIDQMVRALTGCPIETVTRATFTYQTQGKSAEYAEWVRRLCAGDDGPDTYEWDEGIAP